MYLNLHSYYARCSHEGLQMETIRFTVEKGESDEEIAKLTKNALQCIKEYNKDKKVVFTCAIPDEVDENEIIYLNTAWSFAYETEEDRDGLHDLMEEKFNTLSVKYNLLTPAQCPFMNNGEII